MNSLTKTIRGIQRFLSVVDSPFARMSATDLALLMPKGSVTLPKAFCPSSKPLKKGERRKQK